MRKFLTLTSTIAVAQAENPVKKVVSLLTEMQTQMNADAKQDMAAFKKMECYCNKQKDEKDTNVANAENEIENNQSVVESKIGEIAGARQAVEQRTKEIKAAETALKDAAGLREKESTEAAAAQKDMKDTITALTKAVEILGRVNGGSSFLQIEKTLNPFRAALNQDVFALLGKLDSARQLQQGKSNGFLQSKQNPDAVHTDGAAGAREEVLTDHPDVGDAKDSQRAADSAGMKRDYNKLDGPLASAEAADKTGGVAGVASFNSASGGIHGLLSQMLSDFQNQLQNSISEEAAKTQAFADLKAEKEADIALRKKQNTASKQQMSAAQIAQSDAQRALEEAKMDLENSTNFLAELKVMCDDAVTGYGERSKERSAELQAVGEAIKFLTSDAARDAFNKAYSFVQISSVHESNHSKSLIMKKLSTLKSSKVRSLAQMAASSALGAKLDQFKAAKDALNQLKNELAVQQKEEYAARDQCNEDTRNNEVAIADATTAQEDADAAIEDLDGKIELAVQDLAHKQATIDEENAAISQATEDRNAEHEALVKVIKDQQVVIEVLNMALEKLQGFYGNMKSGGDTGATALLSESPKPPKQQQYNRQQGGQGALGLLQVIIDDCNHVIKISQTDDAKGQADYEKMLQQSKDNIATWNEEITTLTGEKGRMEEERAEQQSRSDSEAANLLAAGEEKSAITKRCDFLVKNFDARQESRAAEMESIDQAVAILSGANFGN